MAQFVIQGKGYQEIYHVKDEKPYIQLIQCIKLCDDGVYDRALVKIGELTVTVEKV